MEQRKWTPKEGVADQFHRVLRDLRISVTDRCNFRCVYCMPKEVFAKDFPFLRRTELLTFEEITRLAQVFTRLGVEKIRLTGGEPLVRRDLEDLIRLLSAIPGIRDMALTTNGSLLTPAKAHALREAGLRRVTISLDSLEDPVFRAMNDVQFPVANVLAAIEAAADAGLSPVKINMVVKRGVNDDGIEKMAHYFRGTPHIVRFIEYMDVGTTNGWQLKDVVPAQEILSRISRRWPLAPVEPTRVGEVARRYRYLDGQGEIGIIASVSQPFCHTCTRARLSPEGKLFTCLFGAQGVDLRHPLRSGASDEDLMNLIRQTWQNRRDQYSLQRSSDTPQLPKIEMFRIGG